MLIAAVTGSAPPAISKVFYWVPARSGQTQQRHRPPPGPSSVRRSSSQASQEAESAWSGGRRAESEWPYLTSFPNSCLGTHSPKLCFELL